MDRLFFWIFIFLGITLVGMGPVQAGGALKTNINGLPFRWDRTLVFNPEQGGLKNGVYDSAASIQLVRDAFATWTRVSGVQLKVLQGASLNDGGDTTRQNYKQFYNSDAWNCYDNNPETPCVNPVIFDEDGSIIEDMFGECTQFSILGFSGFTDVAGNSEDPAWTVLRRGQAIFSGACIEPVVTKPGCPPCKAVLNDNGVRTLITHEIGHMLGLGHAQVNPNSYQTCLDNSVCPVSVSEDIPTMFPFLVQGAKMLTLHRDDEVAMQRLYGDPDKGTCQVSGKVLAANGKTELRGVEVVARNTQPGESFLDSISYVSGEEAPRYVVDDKSQGNCMNDCGEYKLTGLTPGETYQICVQRVLGKFTGTRAISPIDPPFQGVDLDCPQELTVECDCSANGDCSQINNLDIVTDNQGVDSSFNVLEDSRVGAGGCSLVKPSRSQSWAKLKRMFYSSLAIQSPL